MRKDKYTIKDLKRDFPNDDACLDFIFENLYSWDCECGGRYRKLHGRRQYQCSSCRFQIAPTSGTIFHKSSTPLTDWFYALFIFSNAKSGISAMELERQLGCTYKTAYRILKQIRTILKEDRMLDGEVEVDLAYFTRTPVVGAVERGGEARFQIIPDSTTKSIRGFLEENVSPTATLITDDAVAYLRLNWCRKAIRHKDSYASNGVHINTMEGMWGHVKRSLKGVQKSVSKKELQTYLDVFAFYSRNRQTDTDRFGVLLGTLLHAAK